MDDFSSSPSTVASQPFASRKVWILLGWIVAAGLLWYFLKDVPIQESWRAIRSIQLWKIGVLAAANLSILLLFGLRWWVVLRSFGQRVPFLAVMGYRLAGFGVSYFTPGPQFGGEPVQVLLLRRHAVPATVAVASVFFDKLLELLANFIFLLLGILTALLSGMIHLEVSPWVWIIFVMLILLPFGHLWLLRIRKFPLTSAIERLRGFRNLKFLESPARFVSRGEELIADFLRDCPAELAGVVFISGFVWVVSIVEFWLMLNFLGARAGWVQTISILTADRIAFLLPIPGGFGTLEASLVFASQAAGLTAAVGLAAGLVIHLRDILFGLIGLWIAGWSSRSSILKG